MADAVGMLSVWIVVAEENPQPPFDDVVAKVCEAPVRPLSEVIALTK